jgi:hypothetical protein
VIDLWKRERTQFDNQIREVRNYLEAHLNRDQYQGSRVKLRILLNDLCVRRMAVHQKIVRYEDEERLTEIFKNISGLSDVESAGLMRDMERLRLLKV